MVITGLGRISLYEPRGSYQIIFEYLEPQGLGALQAAFEQLKRRLAEEGLFDESIKRPLPFLPKRIGIITSPTGAAVRDILNILDRRYSNLLIDIYPTRVQGEGADREIADAIERLNRKGDADVAILARGGGSLEDLAQFNSEIVARAIRTSAVPIVTGVGHETDFTIADFAADLRAPTPSAAAELIVPVKADLLQRVERARLNLGGAIARAIEQHRNQFQRVSGRLVHPKRRIEDLRLKVDDLSMRLSRIMERDLRGRKEHLAWRIKRLHDLGPLSVLERGYSITRTLPKFSVIKDAASVSPGDRAEILLGRGSLICRIEEVCPEGPAEKREEI